MRLMDLVDGPELVVEDAGARELTGITGARQLFRLAAPARVAG